MKRNPYYPIRQGDQVAWLVNFSNKLPGLAATLGLTTAQANAAVADCLWLAYVLQTWLPNVRAWALAASDAAKEAQTGSGSSAQVLPVFDAPDLPAGTVAVNPGALLRIFSLVQVIKGSSNLTESIASNLGIIGAEMESPDLAALKPKLQVVISGGHVVVRWGWEGNGEFLDMLEIEVDRGSGFTLLTYDTTPNYTDTYVWPPAGQSALWKYRAIFRQGDTRVGQWSEVVSIAVGA